MDTVMALCHFCEQHGPSVMFSCEKITPTDTEPNCAPHEVHGAPPKSPTDTQFEEGDKPPTMKVGKEPAKDQKADLCQACRSMPDSDEGFISHDKETGSRFISTQHPDNPEVFRLVRQACVRSLSCEVCPGRQGPILFGDEEHGYVISCTFYVSDNLARGQRRWYSIIYIMEDRIFLIQHYPFLVGCIEKIIDYLQNCADFVYKSEAKENPQRNSRQPRRMTNSVTPGNYFQHRGDTSNARALSQLTGIGELYPYLHTAFTWIIRSCRKRIKEIIVQAPQLEDDIVRAELLAKHSRSSSIISNEDVAAAIANSELKAKSLGEPYQIESYHNSFVSLRHMRDILMPPLFKAIAWHLLIGNQVIWRGKDQQIVTSALHVLKTIIPVGCVKMITDSNVYVKSYEANLLGLRENALIPAHIKNSEIYILIDVVKKSSIVQQRFSQLSLTANPPPTAFTGIEFRMTSGCIIPEKMPSMLHKLEVALANDSLSEEVVKQCLICLKQEWMNTAMVLYKFVKIDNRNTEDTNRLLQVALGCTEEDKVLLKFWMKGLSSQFKDQLIKSARSEKSAQSNALSKRKSPALV